MLQLTLSQRLACLARPAVLSHSSSHTLSRRLACLAHPAVLSLALPTPPRRLRAHHSGPVTPSHNVCPPVLSRLPASCLASHHSSPATPLSHSLSRRLTPPYPATRSLAHPASLTSSSPSRSPLTSLPVVRRPLACGDLLRDCRDQL